MAALNPGQFKGPLYHGTTFDVQGKDIIPPDFHGNSNWGDHGHSGQKSSNHAFATESEHTAWQFGSQAGVMKRAQATTVAAENARSRERVALGIGGEGVENPVPTVDRVRVHEVAPNPMMKKGVYHSAHPDFQGGEDLKEWKAPAFRTKGTIDIMPGRQGTFPSLNWNQFRAKDSGYWSDMNHPTDDDVADGHVPETGPSVSRSFAKGSWAHDQTESQKTGLPPHPVPITDEHQMDLLSGKTVQDHAENDESAVGDYHRNNLFGRL